ncbi:hypothetical protein fugu_003322 [Takifugu bimaculatus]|uniref:Uncharacterized protein n=1 Tax=Takifugu bimaculatus TaxID=433685 RepID=A0A4Z2BFG0_9TELE|nr:hypothetical protein fugu_003322 [Takifugu bimaculatus]
MPEVQLLGGVPESGSTGSQTGAEFDAAPAKVKIYKSEARRLSAKPSPGLLRRYMTQAHILQSKKKPTHLIWFNETTNSPRNRETSPRPQVEHVGEGTEKDR